MKLLDINDCGVGEEIANIQLDREEAEMLFMFVDMFCQDNPDHSESVKYHNIRWFLDGMLKQWENTDDGDGLVCV